MSGHRPERIADLLHRELARLFREELRDPRVGFVTITDVSVSPDLRHARVYVSMLAEDHDTPLLALNGAAPFLRRSLARALRLRYTPQLRFLFDEAAQSGQRVDGILSELGHPGAETADENGSDGGEGSEP